MSFVVSHRSGLKAVMRVEQSNAINDVIEPLKQWFFGGHGGPDMGQVDSSSPMGQMVSMFANAVPQPLTTSGEFHQMVVSHRCWNCVMVLENL